MGPEKYQEEKSDLMSRKSKKEDSESHGVVYDRCFTLGPTDLFFYVYLQPHVVEVTDQNEFEVAAQVSVYYSDDDEVPGCDLPEESKSWKHKNDLSINETVKCVKVNTQTSAFLCDEFQIVKSTYVMHPHYGIRMIFPNSKVGKMDKIMYKISTPKESFAQFEVIIKSLGTTIAIIGTIWLARKLIKPGARWTQQQHWAMRLMGGLIFFNDPFSFLNSMVPAASLGLSVFFIVSFLALLIYYMLNITESLQIRVEKHRYRDTVRRRISIKFLVTFALWAFTFFSYLYVVYKENQDPFYDWEKDFGFMQFVKSIATILGFLFLSYFLYMLTVATKILKQMPFSYVYHFIYSEIICILTVVGMIFQSYVKNNAFQFMVLFGSINFYVLSNAFLMAPIATSYTPYSEFEEYAKETEDREILDEVYGDHGQEDIELAQQKDNKLSHLWEKIEKEVDDDSDEDDEIDDVNDDLMMTGSNVKHRDSN
eukprot:CAMPEP_0114992292 /NCGR_PEP_ID=MMETSP0216-20121206/11857_1 /TAXON_ID=223996 /ORGANISM="Protocruzia adherens, Strain Boccale" /LENGTH=480 /DNA_ID=CAMNT_0002355735 /DNA_START=151 /DNA_END=1593 /DNA_ORIENTATION=+